MRNTANAFGSSVNKLQVGIGLFALAFGSLVYLIDRPPDQTYFVYSCPYNVSLHETVPILFGPIGNSLPTFIHVFAFILITTGLLSPNKRGCLITCACWFTIDCVFELGQRFYSYPLKILPESFASVPFLENTKNYFLYGTFDFIDLAAIFIGTIIAYFVLLSTIEIKER